MIVRDHRALSLSRQCRLLSVGRSSLYYEPKGESAETLALMRRIDELFLKYPFYGARRMALHLRREGVCIGRRRAARLMRLMELQAIYRAPRTSDPHPEHRVWPYLLRGLTIERPNHVWCADITYIPVNRGFLYLVAIMDWASRYVLAWRAVEHAGRELLHRRSRRGPGPAGVAKHGLERCQSQRFCRRAVMDGEGEAEILHPVRRPGEPCAVLSNVGSKGALHDGARRSSPGCGPMQARRPRLPQAVKNVR